MEENQAHAPLSDDWRQWVVESRLVGIDDKQISAVLADHGIDARAALEEFQAMSSHPYYRVAVRLAKRLKKLEAVLDIRRSLSSLARGSKPVERRDSVSREEFLEKYYAANRPVIFTGLMEDWPALSRWNPQHFKTAYGDNLVEVMTGRNQDPRYEINLKAHKREIRFADYVDIVTSAGESNDCYLVANNGFFSRPEMQPLLEDIRVFDEHLDPTKSAGRVHFWFGPAGTVTQLHHDEMNILMAQVYGRKRIILISPDQSHRLYNEIGVYSEVDCENPDYERHPDFRDVQQLQVVLEPGETLFLPVGWWHHVRALDVSITMTFTNFVHLNRFNWWQPSRRR
jgi:hypothetical protein